MSNVRRVYVEKKPAFAVRARELEAEIRNYLGISDVTGVRELIRYDMEHVSEETYRKSSGYRFFRAAGGRCVRGNF